LPIVYYFALALGNGRSGEKISSGFQPSVSLSTAAVVSANLFFFPTLRKFV
jgi:hypothetical protein